MGITCPTCGRVGQITVVHGTRMAVDLSPECLGCREVMRTHGIIPLPPGSLSFLVGGPVGINRA